MVRTILLLSCLCIYPAVLFAYEPTIPEAVAFNTCLIDGPDVDGNFSVSCRVLSKYATLPAVIRIEGGDEIRIKGKKILRGRLKKGIASEFTIECQRACNRGQAVLHLQLRFRYPYEEMSHVVTENAYGRYSTTSEIERVLKQLQGLKASGNSSWTLHRATILD